MNMLAAGPAVLVIIFDRLRMCHSTIQIPLQQNYIRLLKIYSHYNNCIDKSLNISLPILNVQIANKTAFKFHKFPIKANTLIAEIYLQMYRRTVVLVHLTATEKSLVLKLNLA